MDLHWFWFNPDAIWPQVLRWIHFISGIIWIGHLYFFNFVNGPFEKGVDASYKKFVVTSLRPRALWWFRWGAMFTLLSGLAILGYEASMTNNYLSTFFGTWENGPDPNKPIYHAVTKNWWITLGFAYGTIMWFNVWFVIWPRQKKILRGIASGSKPADFDQLVSVATLASRVNTFLSVPLLFAMGARSHFPTGSVNLTIAWMAAVTVVGFILAYMFIFWFAPAVGKEYVAMVQASATPPAKT